jgi:predicted nucleic acid-binding protein
MRLYMDTSALVKLVVAEEESSALINYLAEHVDDSLFSAALARTELIRAVAPNGGQAVAAARRLLDGLDFVALTRQVLDDAGALQPLHLRSLDAIHLVAAQRATDTLRAVVTYDARMCSAADDLGISAVSPS